MTMMTDDGDYEEDDDDNDNDEDEDDDDDAWSTGNGTYGIRKFLNHIEM